jgi:glycosyltransferase involved in cell wall biosynthesis
MRIFVLGTKPRSLVNFRGPLLREMVAQGHDVIVGANGRCEYTEEFLDRINARYYPLNISRLGTNPVSDIRTYRQLVDLLQVTRPDKVLAYTAKPVIYGGLASQKVRPVDFFALVEGLGYAWSGNTMWQRALRIILQLLYRRALREARGVFFLNSDDQADMSRIGALSSATPQIRINGIGVDLDVWAPAPLPAKPTFLFAGRLLKEKGIEYFIEASRRVAAECCEGSFLVAGSPDLRTGSSSESVLQSVKGAAWITFLGQVTDMRTLYRNTSVFVLPSYYREGLPRTIIEAMAMARPIITTDSPGCRETVVNGVNGFLVPARNAQALAEAMEKFIKNPDLIPAMGKESLRMAREKYDVHKVNKVILNAMSV